MPTWKEASGINRELPTLDGVCALLLSPSQDIACQLLFK